MFTDKNEKPIVIVLLILVVVLLIGLLLTMFDRPLFQEPTAPPPYGDDAVMCTMEAKICLDGSSVGRMPPSCEFAPCPGEGGGDPVEVPPVAVPLPGQNIDGGTVCAADAKMCPDGETFVSRTGPDCEFETCPSDTGANTRAGGRIPYGDDIVCAEIYAPVCASVEAECITAPCEAAEETFSNECEANKAGADVLYEGECE